MRAKGLKDIKKSTDKPSRLVKVDITRHSALRAPGAFTPTRAKEFNPKTWIFVSEPEFKSYHQHLLVDKATAPDIEIFEEPGTVIVIAELPGVEKTEDIDLKVEGDVLIIEATGNTQRGNCKFFKEVVLPFQISPDNISIAINNGIMETTLQPTNIKT